MGFLGGSGNPPHTSSPSHHSNTLQNMSDPIGIKCSFHMNGTTTEFAFPALDFAERSGFPASAAPLSVVKASSGEQQQEVLNSYVATDMYANNLIKNATGAKKDLVCLTHALAATRNETDRLLTLAMNDSDVKTNENGKKNSAVPMGGAVGALLSGALEKENAVIESATKKRRVA